MLFGARFAASAERRGAGRQALSVSGTRVTPASHGVEEEEDAAAAAAAAAAADADAEVVDPEKDLTDADADDELASAPP